jgi:aminoglycoside phosphotransferase (APT) family kinase protein
MISATGVRIGWTDLPSHVRREIEAVIGEPVVDAVSQAGGFSPGSADRIRTASGRRVFVKAVSSAANPRSPEMHRQEARVAAVLPVSAPTPTLLGSYDDGEWVALVYEDVEGRHPATPWLPDELRRVQAALTELASVLTPSPLRSPTAADALADDFAGWRRLAAEPPADLDPWLAGHLDDLVALADRGLRALAGDTLVHTDIRADNILLGADGRVTVVDWPSACRGPAWLDQLLLLVNVRLYGGHDTPALLERYAAEAGVCRADLTAALAGLAGFFTDGARQPAPPGLPTLREFQRVQSEAVLSWLREAPPTPLRDR